MSVSLFTPQQLTSDERLELDKEFLALLGDIPKEEELLAALQKFFASTSISNDSLYYADYLRWYAFLCFKNINSLDKTVLTNIVFPRLLVIGILQDIDIWKSLIWYLQIRSLDEADMQTLYRTIRESFFISNQSVGKEKNVDVPLSEIIKLVKTSQAQGSDSLNRAELYTRIQRLLSSNADVLPFISIEKDVAMDRLVGLINFFLGVEPLKIFYIVEAFVSPEHFEIEEGTEEDPEEPDLEINEVSDLKENGEDLPDSIQDLVDAQFEKDESGQYKDIEGVFAFLDELATDSGNDEVRQMLYFDENTGGFVWKDETKAEESDIEMSQT